MKLQHPISESLQGFINIFTELLSKPQINHLASLIVGNLHGLGEIRKIANFHSNRDQSSISRFLLSEAWDHTIINEARISYASEIGQQKYNKYYSLIIDDGVTEKYGKKLPGVGYHYSHMKGKVVWGQTILTSHMIVGDIDIPLYADIYHKKDKITKDTPKFKSKIDIAKEHIEKFPKIIGKKGIVMSDSWFPCESFIVTVIECDFIGLSRIKSNRNIFYNNSFVKVSKIDTENKFDSVTVKGDLYQCIEIKTKLKTGNIPVKLLISQMYDEKNKKWGPKYYLIATDVNMRAFTMIYLYLDRWKIESFYDFSKKELAFKVNRNNSELSYLRLIYIIFLSYTYLMLQKCKLYIYFEESKSMFVARNNFMKLSMWLLIAWAINKTKEGNSLIEIKLMLAL